MTILFDRYDDAHCDTMPRRLFATSDRARNAHLAAFDALSIPQLAMRHFSSISAGCSA
ncbi:hypothetical protein VB151_04940 [Xanthomonas fragariae]|nr:hypothetical protein [Xanthomonas fragariae]MDM7553954.1 hypothetical protein [Xanthomonas fragariae]MDM7557058.1 hypothetical protein [Xanthomonas fragariae]MDM7571661.1 hypothetical protein [Xanthomonas fragariae]MDM7577906.1 hypothetical protein [Xanthomonas fragariae]MDM7580976.1 hypothetical protein [Xanthomonas fragariae]